MHMQMHKRLHKNQRQRPAVTVADSVRRSSLKETILNVWICKCPIIHLLKITHAGPECMNPAE